MDHASAGGLYRDYFVRKIYELVGQRPEHSSGNLGFSLDDVCIAFDFVRPVYKSSL